jgi:hypothetical protein
MFQQLSDLQVAVDRAEAETVARYCAMRPLRLAGMWRRIVEVARREADAYARLEVQLGQRPWQWS